MSIRLPNGATVFIASGYGAVKAMSAISNASSAVATLEASHGVIVGDFVEVTSGWSRLTEKVVKATAVATNDVTFGGIDTLSTTIYPAGSGTGTIREISGWTQLSQILNSSSEGGEQQFFTYQYLESDAEKRIPTIKSAGGLSFEIADDPTLAGQLLATVANDDRLVRALKIVLADASVLLYNAFISVNKTPSLTVNTAMTVPISISLQAEPTRYTS